MSGGANFSAGSRQRGDADPRDSAKSASERRAGREAATRSKLLRDRAAGGARRDVARQPELHEDVGFQGLSRGRAAGWRVRRGAGGAGWTSDWADARGARSRASHAGVLQGRSRRRASRCGRWARVSTPWATCGPNCMRGRARCRRSFSEIQSHQKKNRATMWRRCVQSEPIELLFANRSTHQGAETA